MAIVHVIGAGLAGLACATRLATAGRAVVVHEAAGHAGGRCRSFFDPTVDRTIDNGNHLLLSGNRSAFAYLRAIGAEDTLVGPARAEFGFRDMTSGECWTLRPNRGPIPWWIFSSARRAPHSRAIDYLRGIRLVGASAEATVATALGARPESLRRFWEPLTVAALNASPDEAAAQLLWPVVRETFGRGEAACRPRIAAHGLSPSFVEPALRLLARRGATVRFNRRARALRFAGERLAAIAFGDETMALGTDESAVLAVPPSVAADLVPGLTVPRESRAIANVHFRLATPQAAPSLLGIVGGTTQWIVVRGDVASVTVSAANALIERPAEAIAATIWPEVATALGLGAPSVPPCRVVKERRATFAALPSELPRRPPARTAWANFALAGDWTATGLPATIEGAIWSGHAAAALVLGGEGP